jgi:hypothetical protein
MRKRGNGRTPIYRSYVFKDKDPVIDQLRTLAEDTYGRRVNHRSLREVNEAGGPSTAAMREWFYGKTLRPTSATVEAAGRAMGYKREWVKMGRGR